MKPQRMSSKNCIQSEQDQALCVTPEEQSGLNTTTMANEEIRRPPLLQLGGEANFAAYQSEFDRLFPTSIIDIMGNEVVFNKDRCRHVCFKTSDRKWNKGPRDQWSQERAERLAWIKEALLRPNFVRIAHKGAWAYLLEVKGYPQNNLSPELYVVIVDVQSAQPGTPSKIYFLTAHPISIREWNDWKKNKPWIYPPGEPEQPKASKKNRKNRGSAK